ncbi:hypothetical protein B296_00056309, partial [Ensete ventricosum]
MVFLTECKASYRLVHIGPTADSRLKKKKGKEVPGRLPLLRVAHEPLPPAGRPRDAVALAARRRLS